MIRLVDPCLFLSLDTEVTLLRVYRADRFYSRLVGVGRRPVWQNFDILWLPNCRAVHGLWLAQPIDVVFTDALGRVLRCLEAWPPGRVAWQRGASQIWEMSAGSAAIHGIVPCVTLGVWPRRRFA